MTLSFWLKVFEIQFSSFAAAVSQPSVFKYPMSASYYWGKYLMGRFKARIVRVKDSSDAYRGKEYITFLANHRSSADVFIDSYITGGSSMIAKKEVKFTTPLNCAYSRRTTIFIDRKSGRDKIFKKTDDQLKKFPNNVLVYAEGHRNIKNESLPLKTGFIQWSYQRGRPVQIIITKGKEQIASFKTKKVHKNITLVTCVSPLIRPTGSYSKFEKEVLRQWKDCWKKAYASDAVTEPVQFSKSYHAKRPDLKHSLETAVLTGALGYPVLRKVF